MNNSIGNKASAGNVFWAIYCFPYIMMTLLPSLKYSISYIVAGSFGLFAVLLIFFKRYDLRNRIGIIAILGTVVGILAFILGNAGANDIANTPINYLRFLLPSLLLLNVTGLKRKAQWLVWFFSALILFYVAYTTWRATAENPMIARLLASGSDDSVLTMYRLNNIGGFEICYAIGMTFSAWVALAFDCKKRIIKLIFVFLAIITFVFVISVQYMTLLLLCLLSVFVVLIKRPGNALSKIVFVVIAMVMFFSMSTILRWIAETGVESQIYSKLIHMADFFDGNSSITETTSRALLYKSAFLEFLSSPIWGVAQSRHAAVSHSTILGIACNTGIIGLMVYAFLIKSCYLVTKSILQEYNITLSTYYVTFISFVVLLFLNPIQYSYEISFVVFMFIPLTLILFYGYFEGGNERNESVEN